MHPKPESLYISKDSSGKRLKLTLLPTATTTTDTSSAHISRRRRRPAETPSAPSSSRKSSSSSAAAPKRSSSVPPRSSQESSSQRTSSSQDFVRIFYRFFIRSIKLLGASMPKLLKPSHCRISHLSPLRSNSERKKVGSSRDFFAPVRIQPFSMFSSQGSSVRHLPYYTGTSSLILGPRCQDQFAL